MLHIIPIALQELHESGKDKVHFDTLGEQVTLHDESYLNRRTKLRGILKLIGINLKPLPDGHVRPGPKMYIPLAQLEQTGVVESEFESTTGEELSRRVYWLAEDAKET